MLSTKVFPWPWNIIPIDADILEDPEGYEAPPLTEDDLKAITRAELRRLYAILIEEFEDAT